MPNIRPFRALRFDASSVGDLEAVVAPPYDVIDAGLRERLVARHPANVVRLDLPVDESGDEPDDRYRRAARTLAGWRSDGTLRKDPHPSIYVYEQAFVVPGSGEARTQRGFFGRLRLEPFGPDAGVLPHERTLSAPREDRYRLLRATGVNTSSVVVLFDDADARAREGLDAIARRSNPEIDVRDDDGAHHRLWIVPADGDGPDRKIADELMAVAADRPATIADGHHRYETALRYRDERRMTRSCEEDPAFDYLLTLFLPVGDDSPTVLPTHRLLRGIGAAGASLLEGAERWFEVEPVARGEDLVARFTGTGPGRGGGGRFGLWTRSGGAILTARRSAFEPFLPEGGEAVRELDVTILAVTLEQLAGIDGDAVAGGAVGYTKSALEAVAAVEADDGVDAAFLLEGTPVRSITAVARAGDVMPQKSTYIYPKALTGLVINPHEW